RPCAGQGASIAKLQRAGAPGPGGCPHRPGASTGRIGRSRPVRVPTYRPAMSLSPRWWPASGWRRTVAIRRAIAGVLVLLAAVLALTPSVAPAGTPVLVAVRVLGPAAPVAAAGVPDAAGVPLRLADPAVAALLAPGTRVDVVGTPARTPAPGAAPAAAPAADEPPAVLAGGAVVLAVLPSPDRTSGGPVVLVALPAASAARVAGVSLAQEVTVT